MCADEKNSPIKTCKTCRYGGVEGDGEPCVYCHPIGRNEWQPKQSAERVPEKTRTEASEELSKSLERLSTHLKNAQDALDRYESLGGC